MTVQEITCSGCNRTYQIDIAMFGGKKIRCKECGDIVSVPSGVDELDEFEVVEEEAPRVDRTGFPKPSPPPSLSSNVMDNLFKPGLRNRLILSGGATLLLGALSLFLLIASLLIPPLAILFFICLWLTGIAIMALLMFGITFLKQKEFLLGLWNPGDNSVLPIQFMQNGRVVRLDGVTGHYEFTPLKEQLTIRLPGVSPVTLEVVSITKHELHLSDGGTLQQYTKGETLSEAELRKEAEAMKQKLVSVGNAAAVVGGVAVAGIAALGAASVGGSGGGVDPYRRCPGCGEAISMRAEGVVGLPQSGKCPRCGITI